MSVKIRKRKGAWWIFICYHGRRKAKKVGTREAAERAKREIEARLALGNFGFFAEGKPQMPHCFSLHCGRACAAVNWSP